MMSSKTRCSPLLKQTVLAGPRGFKGIQFTTPPRVQFYEAFFRSPYWQSSYWYTGSVHYATQPLSVNLLGFIPQGEQFIEAELSGKPAIQQLQHTYILDTSLRKMLRNEQRIKQLKEEKHKLASFMKTHIKEGTSEPQQQSNVDLQQTNSMVGAQTEGDPCLSNNLNPSTLYKW